MKKSSAPPKKSYLSGLQLAMSIERLREAERQWRAWRALAEWEQEAQVIARIMAPKITKRVLSPTLPQ